jgi:hypothetical protein
MFELVCPNLIQDNEYRIASALRGKPTLESLAGLGENANFLLDDWRWITRHSNNVHSIHKTSYTPQSSDEISIFTAATEAQEHNREDISCEATAILREGRGIKK